ncbi:hypothetical protein D3C76_331930 [compost metagenome]
MNEIAQLGEMLRQHALSEEHKKQQFEEQASAWAESIRGLYADIEQWLEPVRSDGLLELQREPYIAANAAFAATVSPFSTEKLAVTITGKTVELVPEVMGAKGSITLSVVGLPSDRYGSISLICLPPSTEWWWRKDRGIKEPDLYPFTADFFAQQLQSLIPKLRESFDASDH